MSAHRTKRGKPKRIAVPFIAAFGESNAGGYAANAGASAGELAARPSVRMFNVSTKRLEPLDVGSNNNLDHSGLDSTTHGFEIGLANAIEAGRLVAAQAIYVQCGQGGSTASQWAVGDASGYWTKAVQRITLALAAATEAGYDIEPVVWFSLGINDAVAGTSDSTWKTDVVAIISRLRGLLGAKTPVHMTKFEAPMTVRTAFNTRMDEIAAADPYSKAISSSSAGVQGDNNHWTYSGYKVMAERFIDELRRSNQPCDTPSISPAAGSYSGAQTVTISAPPLAIVRYSLDGSDPSAGTDYTGSFSSGAPPVTVKAVTRFSNRPWSTAASNLYSAAAESTWDSASLGTTIVLSNADKDAYNSSFGTWNIARGTSGKSSGKWYFEIYVVSTTANNMFVLIADNATAGGAGLNSFKADHTGGTRDDGFSAFQGLTASNATGLGSFVTGDTIGVAVDVDNKKFWMARNNTWIASGNPAAGTNEKGTWSAAYTIFPAVGLIGGSSNKARLVPVSTVYSPPSGFTVWG
jgi:hypothetical protein